MSTLADFQRVVSGLESRRSDCAAGLALRQRSSNNENCSVHLSIKPQFQVSSFRFQVFLPETWNLELETYPWLKQKKQSRKTVAKQPYRPSARASVKTYNNYIGGKWVPSESGEVFENINPADTGDVIGRFPLSTSDDVNAAVNAAQSAFDGWRSMPAPKRAEILFRLGEILIRNKDRFTARHDPRDG